MTKNHDDKRLLAICKTPQRAKKLSNLSVKNAQPEDRQYKLRDLGCPGLLLVVNPNGDRWFRLRYRFDKKDQSLELGHYPAVTLDAARIAANDAKALIARGINPSFERKTKKTATVVKAIDLIETLTPSAVTFRQVAIEYIDTMVSRRCKHYKITQTNRLEKYVFPIIGYKSIAELKTKDILFVLETMEEKGLTENVWRMKIFLSQIFCYGILPSYGNDPYCEYDVTAPISRERLKPCPKVIKRSCIDLKEADELQRLLQAIHSYDSNPRCSPITKLALLFCLNVFVRVNEMRHAQWSEINIDKTWIVPGPRMKGVNQEDHYVPLSRQTLAILSELRKINGDNKYIFTSPKSIHTVISHGNMIKALNLLGYNGIQSAHGFRSIASTILNKHYRGNGIVSTKDLVEMQLSHIGRVKGDNKVARAYNSNDFLEERAKMMQWYSDYIADELVRPEAQIVT